MNDSIIPRQLFLDRDYGHEYRIHIPEMIHTPMSYTELSEPVHIVEAVYYYYSYSYTDGKYVYNFAGVRII